MLSCASLMAEVVESFAHPHSLNLYRTYLFFALQYVDVHGGQDDHSFYDVLQREVNAGLIEPLIQYPDDDRADERAGHVGSSSGEARSADHRGGDGVQFEHDSGGGLGGIKLGGVDHTRQARKNGANQVDNNLIAQDRNSGESCSFTVAPDGVEVLPKASAVQQNRDRRQRVSALQLRGLGPLRTVGRCPTQERRFAGQGCAWAGPR